MVLRRERRCVQVFRQFDDTSLLAGDPRVDLQAVNRTEEAFPLKVQDAAEGADPYGRFHCLQNRAASGCPVRRIQISGRAGRAGCPVPPDQRPGGFVHLLLGAGISAGLGSRPSGLVVRPDRERNVAGLSLRLGGRPGWCGCRRQVHVGAVLRGSHPQLGRTACMGCRRRSVGSPWRGAGSISPLEQGRGHGWCGPPLQQPGRRVGVHSG